MATSRFSAIHDSAVTIVYQYTCCSQENLLLPACSVGMLLGRLEIASKTKGQMIAIHFDGLQ